MNINWDQMLDCLETRSREYKRIRGRLIQCSSSTETRCRIVLMPAQATKKETTCTSTGLMRRRWVALTHWGAAGRQAMSKLPAQTGCQAAVLGFQPPPSHQATPRLYTSTTPLGVPMTPGFPLCPCGRCDFANAQGIHMISALISQVQLWSTAQRD